MPTTISKGIPYVLAICICCSCFFKYSGIHSKHMGNGEYIAAFLEVYKEAQVEVFIGKRVINPPKPVGINISKRSSLT